MMQCNKLPRGLEIWFEWRVTLLTFSQDTRVCVPSSHKPKVMDCVSGLVHQSVGCKGTIADDAKGYSARGWGGCARLRYCHSGTIKLLFEVHSEEGADPVPRCHLNVAEHVETDRTPRISRQLEPDPTEHLDSVPLWESNPVLGPQWIKQVEPYDPDGVLALADILVQCCLTSVSSVFSPSPSSSSSLDIPFVALLVGESDQDLCRG